MRLFPVLLTLCCFSGVAFAADLPTTTPFAERFPPASITSVERANEVIAAYEKEKTLWDNWLKEEDKACYRNFFVTYCRDSVREDYHKHIQAARSVWLVARDFNRKIRTDEAVKTRLEKEAKQAERNARIEAGAKERKAPKTGMVTAPSSKRPKEPSAKQSVLTPEQEQANESAYREKQQKHEQQLQRRESGVPVPPSETEEEREEARNQRRAEAEKRRQENIKKREAKAKEYQEQLKLREEQKAKKYLEKNK